MINTAVGKASPSPGIFTLNMWTMLPFSRAQILLVKKKKYKLIFCVGLKEKTIFKIHVKHTQLIYQASLLISQSWTISFQDKGFLSAPLLRFVRREVQIRGNGMFHIYACFALRLFAPIWFCSKMVCDVSQLINNAISL